MPQHTSGAFVPMQIARMGIELKLHSVRQGVTNRSPTPPLSASFTLAPCMCEHAFQVAFSFVHFFWVRGASCFDCSIQRNTSCTAPVQPINHIHRQRGRCTIRLDAAAADQARMGFPGLGMRGRGYIRLHPPLRIYVVL